MIRLGAWLNGGIKEPWESEKGFDFGHQMCRGTIHRHGEWGILSMVLE